MTKDLPVQKGTTTVGIVCKDGIVIAADRRATAGFVVNKHAEKIHKINDRMAVTLAGLVSDAQLMIKLIRAEVKLRDLQTLRDVTVSEAANLLAGMLYNNLRRPSMVPGIVAFLLAGFDKHGTHLYDLGIDGSITRIPDYVSDGSGSVFAIGALEALYEKNMTTDQGLKLAIRAVNVALQRDTATGNGIQAWIITENGIKEAYDENLNIPTPQL